MVSDLQKENDLLRHEIRVLHEAAELTANLVIQQFEQTELEKLKYRQAAANLEGFKRTLDQTSDCVFMFDPQTYLFTYVNHGGINQSGYSEDELRGMSFADLGGTMTRARMAEMLAPLIENPSETILYETIHRRKNGVEVPVEVFIQYIAPAGIEGRFFSIVRNISKRLIEEKEKEQLQTKLLHAHKLESVGELAAGIAHEIDTPIQFIGTNLSFLDEAFAKLNGLVHKFEELLQAVKQKKSTDKYVATIDECIDEIDLSFLTEELPKAIKQANEGVDRVSKLVLAMKEFSHPGSKGKEQAELNKIIETTVQITRHEWKYCADVELELAEDLPLVFCHSNDISQVLLNLLINAAHSIQERLEKSPQSPKGLITIKTSHDNGNVTIQITDNGGGISDEIITRIFDPFFTTKEVDKGTGQGLAIARNVIQIMHDGEIEVTSKEGEGSTFTIHLPCSSVEDYRGLR